MQISFVSRGLIASAFACAVMISACSSSDSPTGAFGSVNDPDFMELQPEVNNLVDNINIAMSFGFDSYNEVPTNSNDAEIQYGPVNPGENNGVTYEYTSDGWHHIIVIDDDANFARVINDSIQFKSGSTIQQLPSGADRTDFRHHWSVIQWDQAADYKNTSGDVGLVFGELLGSTALINGTYDYGVVVNTVMDTTTTNTDYDFDATISNVQVNKVGSQWGPSCPASGQITFTVGQTRIIDTPSSVDTVGVTWTGTILLSDGVASISFTNGTETWSYSHNICGSNN